MTEIPLSGRSKRRLMEMALCPLLRTRLLGLFPLARQRISGSALPFFGRVQSSSHHIVSSFFILDQLTTHDGSSWSGKLSAIPQRVCFTLEVSGHNVPATRPGVDLLVGPERSPRCIIP